MTDETTHLRAQRGNWGYQIELALFTRRDDKQWVGAPVTMEPLEDGQVPAAPTMELTPQAAQVLMDDLWTAGLRPSEGTGSAGALAATQEHLKDMRKLIDWAYDPENQMPPFIVQQAEEE